MTTETHLRLSAGSNRHTYHNNRSRPVGRAGAQHWQTFVDAGPTTRRAVRPEWFWGSAVFACGNVLGLVNYAHTHTRTDNAERSAGEEHNPGLMGAHALALPLLNRVK